MGLLNRARFLSGPMHRAKEIISRFRYSPGHINYPSGYFSAFMELLESDKGALLFPDRNAREFYPWLARKLNRSTVRRLRIPFEHPQLVRFDSSVTVVNDPETIRSFVPDEQPGMFSLLVIVRIKSSDIPDVLVLSLNPGQDARDSGMQDALKHLVKHMGQGLLSSRFFSQHIYHHDAIDVAQWVNTWEQSHTLVAIIDFSHAIDLFVDAVEGLDLYRARQDVVAIVIHVTGRLGRVHDLKDGRIMIIFPEKRLPEKELYLVQLGTMLSSMVFNLKSPPELPSRFYTLPEEKDDVLHDING